MECPVCRLNNAQHVETIGTTIAVGCPRCGRYKHTAEAFEGLMRTPQEKRPILSSWVWEQNRSGFVPTITAENLPTLISSGPLPFIEKAKRLLLYMADRTERLGQPIAIYGLEVGAMLETFDNSDISFVANFLEGEHWAHRPQGNPDYRLTGPGMIKADELRRVVPDSTQGFVAMWFDPSLEDAWTQGLQKGVADAGYKPLRIDMREHVNKICDEIISEIRRSRFLVADYTGHRGGVYYEAGYAAGRNLPVILTCRQDQMDQLHFDIRQYNCIDWQTPAELARRLQVRIEAVLGDGPLKTK